MNTMKRRKRSIINRSGTYCRGYYAILILSLSLDSHSERGERQQRQCRINPDSNGFANGVDDADGRLPLVARDILGTSDGSLAVSHCVAGTTTMPRNGYRQRGSLRTPQFHLSPPSPKMWPSLQSPDNISVCLPILIRPHWRLRRVAGNEGKPVLRIDTRKGRRSMVIVSMRVGLRD